MPERSSVGSKEGLQIETCSASLKQRFQRQRTPSETLQDVNRGREADLGSSSKQKKPSQTDQYFKLLGRVLSRIENA